ncbi:hypothetical protein PsorP6_003955 [Peronosclerospora sorghi]|uniref:Uncharacterized protein n=1 Tax=Peronosclerospora sorghi TaxID=230839 RepID=A0ACC0VRQ2_9STRA|nr:hypothetical protein PsorP6_003955 [Peronosclerospora sorghi]
MKSTGERPEYAALRLDPTMQMYFKMLSFGVPSIGVAQKMTQDEISREKVVIFLAGSNGSNSMPVGNEDRASVERPKLNRRDSTFRKVYWTSLESKKVNETIWARVTSRRKTAPIALSPKDFKELEQRFGNRTEVSRYASKENAKKKTKFSALDSRRANNISIGLSQFKPFGGVDAILSALKACDFVFLSVDRLTTLLQIAPNNVESKRYSNFRGSRLRLETPEKFLVDMCEIPRVTEKARVLALIQMMLFVLQFRDHVQELRKRVQVITKACYEVLQSERLARCFELILTIGNLLNTGTELEGAYGITLGSLLKLSETKTIDGSMSLLQFIVKLIHVRAILSCLIVIKNRGEDDVLLFVNDLETLAEARRFSYVNCDSQTRALRNEIHKCELEIEEDMEQDLRQCNEAETLRKLRIEKKPQKHQLTFIASKETEREEVVNIGRAGRSSPRNAVLNAIRQRGVDNIAGAMCDTATDTRNNPRSGLLAAIRSCSESDDVNAAPAMMNGGSQTALLAAIREQSEKLTREKNKDVTNGSSTDDLNVEPRQYQTKSKFILIMRERLLSIKRAFEEVEMEWETLRSVWGCTARYVAEDTSDSSPKYVFRLLHKFVLDVKVAKTLLFRTGLSCFTNVHTLLPNAHVGSIVATKFGSGVITALRVADERIEVKFPWSKEAYLSPSAILSVGSLVRCRHWGVGIIRKACYDEGFCEVRFSFGYGKVRVEDLTLEPPSNQYRRDILSGGFCHGDPVLTPFGCGHVQSIRGPPQSPAAVLSVIVLASDSCIGFSVCRSSMALAFVPAHNVKHNF